LPAIVDERALGNWQQIKSSVVSVLTVLQACIDELAAAEAEATRRAAAAEKQLEAARQEAEAARVQLETLKVLSSFATLLFHSCMHSCMHLQ